MCGIYGAFSTDRRPAGRGRRPRADGARPWPIAGRTAGARTVAGPVGIGMRRLSIIDLAGGDAADRQRGRLDLGRLQRRDLQLPRADRRARGARATASRPPPTPRSCSTSTRSTASGASSRCAGCSPSPSGTGPGGSLLLARDRLGIKPLYYAATPEGLLFGSELKALLQSPWLPPRLDRRGLCRLPASTATCRTRSAILEGVAKLPPGHTLRVRAGRPAAPRRYWQRDRPSSRRRGRASREEDAAAELCGRSSRTRSAPTWSATCRSARS